MVCKYIGRANMPKKGSIVTRESDARHFKVSDSRDVKMIGGHVYKEFTLAVPKGEPHAGFSFKTDLRGLERSYLLGKCNKKGIAQLIKKSTGG